MKLRVSWGRRRLQLSRGMAWPTLLLAMQAAYDAWYFSLDRRHTTPIWRRCSRARVGRAPSSKSLWPTPRAMAGNPHAAAFRGAG